VGPRIHPGKGSGLGERNPQDGRSALQPSVLLGRFFCFGRRVTRSAYGNGVASVRGRFVYTHRTRPTRSQNDEIAYKEKSRAMHWPWGLFFFQACALSESRAIALPRHDRTRLSGESLSRESRCPDFAVDPRPKEICFVLLLSGRVRTDQA